MKLPKKLHKTMQHPNCVVGISLIYKALERAKIKGEVCVMIEDGTIFALCVEDKPIKKDK
jgi:hypothetical protein